MRPWLTFGAVALVFVACAPPPSTALKDLVDHSQVLAPCSTEIPGEWSPSFPVPLRDGNGRKFKIFFYALEGRPGVDPTLYVPGGEAVVDLSAAKVDSCDLLMIPVKTLSGQRWSAAADRLSFDGFDSLQTRLTDRIEKIAPIYASGRPPSAKDVALAKEFIRLWDEGSEPLYQPWYYRLNPDFWEWLRAVAGQSIPKA